MEIAAIGGLISHNCSRGYDDGRTSDLSSHFNTEEADPSISIEGGSALTKEVASCHKRDTIILHLLYSFYLDGGDG
jgi:hypothetical protein